MISVGLERLKLIVSTAAEAVARTMSSIVSMSDKQKRILAALKEKRELFERGELLSLRDLAKKHNVPRTTLQRYANVEATGAAILRVGDGRGRRQRLSVDEETMISAAILEFQRNGTPLDRDALKGLVQTFVSTLPAARQKSIGFRDNIPGADWVRALLLRNSTLALKTRINLEHDRSLAMNPENVATHFARIKALCAKHSISDGCYVFNLDESGFSIRGMTLGGRSKCIVQRGTRANTREPKFKGTCDHVTLMPVVSAAGQVYTPVVVLPGKEARYRKRPDGSFETPSRYLPTPNYLFMRPIAGVDSTIFHTWAEHFVQETAFLRRNGNALLLVLDGYASHLTYKTLSLLKQNNIIVAGLPAHTSHALQPLDVGVFASCKEQFKRLLSRRSITTTTDTRNDIFTVCELLKQAYHHSLTAGNIMGGFRRSGLWCPRLGGPDPEQIRGTDFTSSIVRPTILDTMPSTRSTTSMLESSDAPAARVHTYKQLYNLYLERSRALCSDGTITETGTVRVCTTSGATLTSDNVIEALRVAQAKKKAEAQRKAAAEVDRQQRRVDREVSKREKEKARTERDKKAAEKEESALQLLKTEREVRRRYAGTSRRERRAKARQDRERRESAAEEAALQQLKVRRRARRARAEETRDERRRKARARNSS